MPKITLDITHNHLAKLQEVATAYNANNGTSLTVTGFLLLNSKDVAIAAEIGPRLQAIQQQGEQDAQAALRAAVTAERDRLLAELTPQRKRG